MTTNISYKCPCCGQKTLDSEHMFDICSVCGWEDDNVQFSNPDFRGGANFFSLNEYRNAYLEGKDVKKLQKEAASEYAKQVKHDYAVRIRKILQKRIDFGSSDYWTQVSRQELIDFIIADSFEFRRFRKETATQEENGLLDESGINFENCKTPCKRKRGNSLFAENELDSF
ncbi:MAG: hypothetical protein II098_10495 [Treponema sp.]|nr:hypothetical protein [Treponema sp.]